LVMFTGTDTSLNVFKGFNSSFIVLNHLATDDPPLSCIISFFFIQSVTQLSLNVAFSASSTISNFFCPLNYFQFMNAERLYMQAFSRLLTFGIAYAHELAGKYLFVHFNWLLFLKWRGKCEG
jgi:hypothetical protein